MHTFSDSKGSEGMLPKRWTLIPNCLILSFDCIKMVEFDNTQLFYIHGIEMLPQGGNSFVKSVSLTRQYHPKNVTGSLVKMDLQLMLYSPASNLSSLLESLN